MDTIKSLNSLSTPQFKKKGPRREKQHISVREDSFEHTHLKETVYRILCQSKKIGGVIGKGGNIVKSLREETQAKITVSDSIPGSDDRLITIFSLSDKQAKRKNSPNGTEAEKGNDSFEPHCAAQDALLKVHDRIVEEDLGGTEGDNKDDVVITVRILVSNNTVGCLLGRKGDVIERLRSETGANIRVQPANPLIACAMISDELVQISGKPAIAKVALYEVSTLLHQNPRKDRPHVKFPAPHASLGFHPPRSPVNGSWLECSTDSHSTPPIPWRGGYGTRRSGLGTDEFDGFTPPRDVEAPSEFCMKILCSDKKIGGVIGRGGLNIRQLEQETGASIHIEKVSPGSDDGVIFVSSFEVLRQKASQTVDAILHLQNKTSEYSEKGTITTRLLVPSTKVGCILGQGGQIINEMRRRTLADIRIFSKEEKPKCASEDEELVQISGSFGVAKDALIEIASRLRTRCLCDYSSKREPAPVRPVTRYGPSGHLHTGGLPSSRLITTGKSGRHANFEGGHPEYEFPSFPVRPRATGYPDINDDEISYASRTGGSQFSEFAGSRVNPDPYPSHPDHFSASRNVHQSPASAGTDNYAQPRAYDPQDLRQANTSFAGSNNYPQPGVYDSFSSQHPAFPSYTASPIPYRNPDVLPIAYKNIYTPTGSNENIHTHGSYQY